MGDRPAGGSWKSLSPLCCKTEQAVQKISPPALNQASSLPLLSPFQQTPSLSELSQGVSAVPSLPLLSKPKKTENSSKRAMEKEEEKQDCDSTQDLESKKEDDKSTIGDGSDIREMEPVCTVLDSTESAAAHKTQCPQEPKKQKKVAYTVETKTESEESKTVNAAASHQHGRRKSTRLTPKDIRRKASIKYSKHGPGTKTKNELEEEEEEDEEDEDAGCSSAEWRAAKTGGKARQLTEQQIKAFREVFGLFDRNSENCVNAPLLGSRLKDLGLSVGEEELKMAVQSADIDGDGMVNFEDFLAVVTDFRRFSRALNVSSNFAKEVHSKDVVDTVFYTVITKMVGMGALSHKQTGEIVRYYHAMFMRTLKKKLMKLEGDHVIGDYSKGASLMGLTDKQLLKYLKPLCGSKSCSPYSVLPCLTAEAQPKRLLRKPGPRHPALNPEGEPGGHISLHRKNTVIAMRPGPKTKKMISPVQVKLRISKKTRSTMRYNNMALIRKRVKEGSNRYLKELFQSKQRDTSKLWDELGKWNTPETLESFQQNFSTYSWSWTGCRNLLEIEDLKSQRLFPSFHTQMSSPPSSTASHSRPLSSACSTDSDPEQVEEVRQVD